MTPLSAASFQVATCQATLFTPDSEVSASRILRELMPTWGNHFDGEPTILPPLDGLPREVPRVILATRSGDWRCEIASPRVNLFWTRVASNGEAVPLGSLLERAAELLAEYVRIMKPRVARAAAITNSFARHETPALYLARHFCSERWQKEPLNRPENFELHSHKRFSLGGKFTVNSWVRSKSAAISLGDATTPAVIVEQDLNTLVEESSDRAFNESETKEFFALAVRELPTILGLYFPVTNQ